VIYGNGETCNNGVNRKAIVEYVCARNSGSEKAVSVITKVLMVDECTLKIVVESTSGCSVESICGEIYDAKTCWGQIGLCQWDSGTCFRDDGVIFEWSLGNDYPPRKMGAGKVVLIVFLGGGLLVLMCGLFVYLRKRRASRGRNVGGVVERVGVKKAVKKTVKKEVEFAPFQVPFQLVPGGFAPNPYSDGQGYPMTTLLVPAGHQDEQQV